MRKYIGGESFWLIILMILTLSVFVLAQYVHDLDAGTGGANDAELKSLILYPGPD